MSSSYTPVTGILLSHRLLIKVRSQHWPGAVSDCKVHLLYLGLIAALTVLVPPAIQAAVWTIDPLVDLSTSYADNVTLAAKGQERDDFVLGVSPGVTVHATGRELNMLFNYGYERLFYLSDSDRDYSRQLFQGSADAVLVPDFLFVGGSGRISQQLVDPLGSAGLGNLAVSENVGEVRTWTLSPFMRRRMGDLQLALGINFDMVDYPGRSRDSFSREYRFEAGSNTQRKHAAEWQLGLSRREIFFEGDDADQLYDTVSGIFRYHLTPEWSVETSAGYVRNNFPYDPLNAQSPQGGTWTAGFLWAPSPRTVVSAGVGEHYFGSTHFANIEHRGRFNTFHYSYSEDISSARQLQVKERPKTDDKGDPIPGPKTTDPATGKPSELDLLIVSQTTEVFVGKRSKLTWVFRSTHVSFGADAYRERRELQSSGGTETVAGEGVNAGWHPSGRTDFLTSYSKQTADFIIGRQDVFRDVKLGVNRHFTPKVTGSLDYSRNSRESSADTITDYVNHVVTASVRILF